MTSFTKTLLIGLQTRSVKVLVTGGLGFIGSHTVDLLLSRGYEVRVLDSLQPRVHPNGLPAYARADVDLQLGDVASKPDLSRALLGIDVVVHLAAYQDYLPDFAHFIHTNAESAALLFELILEHRYPVTKLLFASSQAVAGEGKYECGDHGVMSPGPRPIEQLERGDWDHHCPVCGRPLKPLKIDEGICHPHTAYGVSKYAVELLASSLGSRYGIPTACMRYTYVQGSRNSFFNAYSGICRIFALRILNGLPPVCYEDGQQLRDYVNVADVARANLLALEQQSMGHHVFNVGGGTGITVREFADVMLKACDSPLEPITPGEFRLGDTRHTVSDNAAMEGLGWRPTVPVNDSVREYLEWMPRHSGTKAYLEEANRVMRAQQVIRSVALKT